MRKKLLRFLRFAPIALLFASTAFAQTTSTIIGVVTDASTGKPVEGAVVIATSPNLQGEQTAVTSKDGSFRITLLPPGQYKLAVQIAGFRPGERSDIRLGLDKTLRANMAVVPEAVTLEEQVVKTGTQAPVINVGSAETGAVISRDFVAAIPVGRTFESVAVTVPGAQADALGIGFSGGQSLDNAYILDGLNVADPVYAGNSSAMLTNFTEEIDVKTGSFMAEYGRATGGVVNVVTKSGSNEFHGSVFSNLRPDWMVKPSGIPAGTAGYSLWYQERPQRGSYYADYGFEVGGPIKKDKLWFYAGFAPTNTRTAYERYQRAAQFSGGSLVKSGGQFLYDDVPGSRKKYQDSIDTYQFTGKLTYLVNENNTLSLAATGNLRSRDRLYGISSTEELRMKADQRSVFDLNARYAGKFLDKKLIVEAVLGLHRTHDQDNPKDVQVTDASGATFTTNQRNDYAIAHRNFTHFWNISTFEAVGPTCTDGSHVCRAFSYRTGGLGYLNLGEDSTRYAGRVSASYLASAFGSHNVKGGIDLEQNYYDLKKDYSGNGGNGGGFFYYYDTYGGFLQLRAYGSVRGGAQQYMDGTIDKSYITYGGVSTKTLTSSNALYAQDSWQVLDTGVTLNAGIRWETQGMKDRTQSDSPNLSINDNIAPRLAVIYDPTRSGRSKIAANWGRYYEMIPLDMAGRAFGSERQVQAVYGDGNATTGACPGGVYAAGPRPFDPRACDISPNGADFFGLVDINNNVANIVTIGGVSPVAPDIKGMYVDQFGASAEYEVLSDLSVGVTYEGRRLGRAIEDMSSNDGASYFIGNPGESKPWDYTFSGYNVTQTLNPRGVYAVDAYTGRTYFAPFPKPRRDYDGITFKVQKNFSRNWQAFASYTYSRLVGNYTGLYSPDNGQTDPNITSQYDLPGLMPNRDGPLSADHPHTIKLYGSYTWIPTQRLSVTGGGAYTGHSGNSVSYLGAHPLYGASEAFVLPRGMGGYGAFVNQFDLKGSVEYIIKAPYTVRFTVDLFNVLNDQTATQLDNNRTYSYVLPILGSGCHSKNAAGKADPVKAALADCPDLGYLRTIDGRPAAINSNWGRPVAATSSYNPARSLRLGLSLSF